MFSELDNLFFHAYCEAVENGDEVADSFMGTFFDTLRQMDKKVGGKPANYKVKYIVHWIDETKDSDLITLQMVARNKYDLVLKIYKYMDEADHLESVDIFNPQRIISYHDNYYEFDDMKEYLEQHACLRNQVMMRLLSAFFFWVDDNHKDFKIYRME